MNDNGETPSAPARISRETVDRFLETLSTAVDEPCALDEHGAVTLSFDEGRQISLIYVENVEQLICEVEIAPLDTLADGQLSDLLALNLASDWTGTGVLALNHAGDAVVYIASMVIDEDGPSALDAAIGEAMMAAGTLSNLLETGSAAAAGGDAARLQMA